MLVWGLGLGWIGWVSFLLGWACLGLAVVGIYTDLVIVFIFCDLLLVSLVLIML